MNTVNKNKRGLGNFKTAAADTSPADEDKDPVAVDTTRVAEDKGTAEVDMSQASADKNLVEVDTSSAVEDKGTTEVETSTASADKNLVEVGTSSAAEDKDSAALDTSPRSEDKDTAEVLSSGVMLQVFNELIDVIIKKLNKVYKILKNYIWKTQMRACAIYHAIRHIVIYRIHHEVYNQKIFKGELGHDPKT